MKVFYVSWNDPETAFHEMLWKKNFTVYPSLKGTSELTIIQHNICRDNKFIFRNFDGNDYFVK